MQHAHLLPHTVASQVLVASNFVAAVTKIEARHESRPSGGFFGGKMKRILTAIALLIIGNAFAQQSGNWKDSPDNWNNSSSNWKNSPDNWKNSSSNYNSQNGVYDNQGNRQGYQVQAPSGVVNYFDNNGNRIGYAPK